jgi:beta-hydroxylase
MSVVTSIKAAKRRLIHQSGKHLLRTLGDFQGRHSLAGTTPFLPNDEFPWVADLENNWQVIRSELDRVLVHKDEIPSFHQISPDQARISKGDNWKTFVFYGVKVRVDENCAQCPNTAELLDNLPTLQNAWFSILAPRYHIPPHKGPTRAFIRCHLGLQVPQDAENCWIRVDQEVRHWQEGQCMVFDDTYEHEVLNDTDEQRVVLFLDFDRPMDRVGESVNRMILKAIKSSHYFKDPMRNMVKWAEKTARWQMPESTSEKKD